MTNRIKLFAFTAMFVVAGFSSCKKGDKGDTGPQGAQGNANVQTYSFTVASSSWTLIGNEYDATITVPALTQNVLDKGLVSVFTSADATHWSGLPLSFQGREINFVLSLSTVSLVYTLDNGSSPSSPPNNNQFKVIIVPGSSRLANPNVNWNDYKEVKAALNLRD